jgi:hypothetical protein
MPRSSSDSPIPPPPWRVLLRRLLIALAVAAVVFTAGMLTLKALLAMLLSRLTR